MSPIVDYGMTFDGKCCVCREWINPDDPIWTQGTPVEGCGHTVAHAPCDPDGRIAHAKYLDAKIAVARIGALTDD